ncbi:hypothetical protein AVEN_107163-1 [Araneus ventricosus]|uniref:ZP domain-containing protein n=1 Tax=Araneus ventricosus TaxID=182803 RepID=A0A4Y2N0J9_ARAVE|nr:hypothetical protein AVEN_107163-1 [Araneus ventricosus]
MLIRRNFYSRGKKILIKFVFFTAHYDISLRYLTLADPTRSHEEVVVMNGCSVDPFVLDVYPPVDGVLRSQFRAFKFQSSDFVIFLATVSVCLQQCVEVSPNVQFLLTKST